MVLVHDILGFDLDRLKLDVVLFEVLAAHQLDLVELLLVLGEGRAALLYHILNILVDEALNLFDTLLHELGQLLFLGVDGVTCHYSYTFDGVAHFLELLAEHPVQVANALFVVFLGEQEVLGRVRLKVFKSIKILLDGVLQLLLEDLHLLDLLIDLAEDFAMLAYAILGAVDLALQVLVLICLLFILSVDFAAEAHHLVVNILFEIDVVLLQLFNILKQLLDVLFGRSHPI